MFVAQINLQNRKICFIFVAMEEINDFRKWLDKVKRSLQSLTDKLESRTAMSEKDDNFMEELHNLYENGNFLDA